MFFCPHSILGTWFLVPVAAMCHLLTASTSVAGYHMLLPPLYGYSRVLSECHSMCRQYMWALSALILFFFPST